VERSREWRQQTRNDKTREYFYGNGDTFSPASQVISFDDVVIYRVGGGPVAPATALPIGQKSRVDPVRLTSEHPSSELVCWSSVGMNSLIERRCIRFWRYHMHKHQMIY